MPYWRLSGVYFAYFAVVGATWPYWSLYLKHLGFSSQEIGLLVAIPMLTRVGAPLVWSWFSDRMGKRLLVTQLGSLGACLCFSGVFFTSEFATLTLVLIGYSIFWNAVQPQFEAITLSFLGDHSHSYSRIRVWGSIGFIASVLSLGILFETLSIRWLPLAILILLLAIFTGALALPKTTEIAHQREPSLFLKTLTQPRVMIFFSVLLLIHFSHGAYYVFYSIHLDSFGYSKSLIGVLWTIGVVSEIFIFIKMPRLFSTFSRFHLLSITCLLTCLRWVLIGQFPSNIYWIVFAQAIHAFSFGVIHAIAMEFINSTFLQRAQGKGQAFYSSLSYGCGGSLGALASGAVWQLSPALTFYMAALAAFVSWILAIVFLRSRL